MPEPLVFHRALSISYDDERGSYCLSRYLNRAHFWRESIFRI